MHRQKQYGRRPKEEKDVILGRSFSEAKASSALPLDPPSNLDRMVKNDSMQNMLALTLNIFYS
jgi:hypothetical protein